MTRGQRILVLLGLLGLAWLLHVGACDWVWKEPRNRSALIVGIRHGSLPPGLQGAIRGVDNYSGLFVGQGGQLEETGYLVRLTAVVMGVVLPLGLIMLDAWLVLGWRARDRLRRGLCLQCGYDLRGNGGTTRDRCPECGWTRAAAEQA